MRCPDGYTGDGRVCRGMAHSIFHFIHLVPGCTREPNTKTKWTEPLFEDFHFFRELFIGMKFPVNRLHQWGIGIVILRIDFNFLLFRMLLSWRKKGEGSTQAETEIGQKGNLVFIPSLLPIMIQSLFHAWFTVQAKLLQSLFPLASSTFVGKVKARTSQRETRPELMPVSVAWRASLGALLLLPVWDASPSQGYPPAVCRRYPFIHLGEEV